MAVIAVGLLAACAEVDGADLALTVPEMPSGAWSDEDLRFVDVEVEGFYVDHRQKTVRDRGWLTVEMAPAGSTPLADPYLEVMRYKSGVCETVATDDDSGPGLAARCSFLAAPGKYVFAFSTRERNATGGYRCRLMPGEAATNPDSRADAIKQPLPDLAAALTAWLEAK